MADVRPKRVLGAVALLGLLAVVALALSASATDASCDRTVTSGGNIQENITAAADNDVICVDGGTYSEELTVNRTGLTLRNHTASDFPVVDGATTLQTGMEIVNASVTIRGINVTGFTGNGINVTDHNATILETNVSDNAEIGIVFAGASPHDGVVRDSKISGQGGLYAIRIDTAHRVKIETSNISSNTADGISTVSSDDLTIVGNTVNDNDNGTRVASGTGALVADNNVTRNAFDGIEVRSLAHGAVVRGNNVSDNTDSAVVVDSSDDVVVRDLVATGNGNWVLDVQSASNLRVTGATITGNPVRAAMVQSSDNVTLENSLIDGNDRVHIRTTPDAVVANNTISNATGAGGEGIFLNDAFRATVVNNTVVDNGDHGIQVRASDEAVLGDDAVRRNGGNGIWFEGGATNNTVRDTTVSGNELWAFNTTDGGINFAARLNVTNSTRPATMLNFEARNASVRGNGSSQPSNADADSIGRFFDAEGNAAGAYVDVDVHYLDSDLPSTVDETTLAVWNLSGGSWVELPSTVDTSANLVSANVTGFSPFGVFGTEDTSGDGGDGGDGAAPSADFVVTSATVSATDVTVGENLTVTATVENRGDAGGTQGVGFRMGDGIIRSRSLHLAAGESGTVSLTHTYDEPGTFHVSVQDVAAGSVTVVAEGGGAQPDIRVTQPSLSPMSVAVGDSTEACATFENDGDASRSVTVEIALDGETVASEQITLAAGASETVCRSFTPSQPGEYEVAVSGATAGTLTVKEGPGDGEDGETVPGFGLVAAAVSLVVVARIVERRR